MTSTTNARELDRVRTARTKARERFAQQMRLLGQIEKAAADLDVVVQRWRVQLAALAELAGGTGPAAALTGLAKAEIDAAVKSVGRAEVDAALAAALPVARRRQPAAPGGVARGGAAG